jgi:type IV pilus assembly protein PilN
MIRINLLPRERLPRKKISPGVRRMIFSGLIAAIILGGGLGYLYHRQKVQISSLEAEKSQIEQQKTTLLKRKQEVTQLVEEIRKSRERLDIINQLLKTQKTWVHVVDEMVDLIPSGLWLGSVQLLPAEVQIQGSAFSNLLVSKFMDNLSLSSYFEPPELISTLRSGAGGKEVVNFRIRTRMRL